MAKSIKSQVNPWFTDDTVGSSDARAFGVAAFSAKPNSLYDVEGGIIPNSGHLGGFGIKSAGSAGNPKVTVYGGRLVLPVANQHAYICLWPTAQDVNLDVPHATNPRIDLLVARVRSDELGDPTKDQGFYVETITGTPATTPQEPTVPPNSMKLWSLKIEPNKGITTVTDYRIYTRAVGGVRPSKNDGNRAGSYPYDLRITDKGALDMWTQGASGWQWERVAATEKWIQFDPILKTEDGKDVKLGTGGFKRANYQQVGRILHVMYYLHWGTTPECGEGRVYTHLPENFKAGDDNVLPLRWLSLKHKPMYSGLAVIHAFDTYPDAKQRINFVVTQNGKDAGMGFLVGGGKNPSPKFDGVSHWDQTQPVLTFQGSLFIDT